MNVQELTKALIPILGPDFIPKILKTHGIVHESVPAEINGKKGFLVWDFIVWNEITFDDEDGNIMSLFNSVSDDETKAKWNEFVSKFGV